MDEVGYPQPKPTILYNDNSGAILLMQNTKNNIKVKHINICYHYICECMEEGEIEIHCVVSANNLADMFTKQLPRVTFQKHCTALQLYEGPSSQGSVEVGSIHPDTISQATQTAHICVMSWAVLHNVSLYFYLHSLYTYQPSHSIPQLIYHPVD